MAEQFRNAEANDCWNTKSSKKRTDAVMAVLDHLSEQTAQAVAAEHRQIDSPTEPTREVQLVLQPELTKSVVSHKRQKPATAFEQRSPKRQRDTPPGPRKRKSEAPLKYVPCSPPMEPSQSSSSADGIGPVESGVKPPSHPSKAATSSSKSGDNKHAPKKHSPKGWKIGSESWGTGNLVDIFSVSQKKWREGVVYRVKGDYIYVEYKTKNGDARYKTLLASTANTCYASAIVATREHCRLKSTLSAGTLGVRSQQHARLSSPRISASSKRSI